VILRVYREGLLDGEATTSLALFETARDANSIASRMARSVSRRASLPISIASFESARVSGPGKKCEPRRRSAQFVTLWGDNPARRATALDRERRHGAALSGARGAPSPPGA
jgi:hypothetical protein